LITFDGPFLLDSLCDKLLWLGEIDAVAEVDVEGCGFDWNGAGIAEQESVLQC
jgi:hypothetical protein